MEAMPVWIRRMVALAGVLVAVGAVTSVLPLASGQTAQRAGRTMEPKPPKPGDDKKKLFFYELPDGIRHAA